MKILAESQFVLSEPLRVMGVAVSTKPVIPELSCVNLYAKGGNLGYFATTGHLSLLNPIDNSGITIEQEGSILVNYDLLVAALSSIVGPISLYTTDRNLIIASTGDKRISRRLPLAVLDNLPNPAVISGIPVVIPSNKLIEVIKCISFAAIKDGSRPELRGMYIGSMSMCGDGIRLACYDLTTDASITISFEAISALQQLLTDDGDISITVDSWILVELPGGKEFRFAGTGELFPETARSVVDALSAKTAVAVINIGTKALYRVFNAACTFTEKAAVYGIAYVELLGSNGTVHVKTEVPSVGMFEDILDCAYMGGDFTVLVSPQNMLDLIAGSSSEVLEFRIYSSLEPMLVSSPDVEGWKVVQGVMANSQPQEVVDNDDF